jgi:hypothetical protein
MRKFEFQEEIKIIVSEVFRDGDITDEQWTNQYEGIKKVINVNDLSDFISIHVHTLGITLKEAVKALKITLQQKKDSASI